MTKDELKDILENSTERERGQLDDIASGNGYGHVHQRFVSIGLVANNASGFYYLSSRLSEYWELRAAVNFA